MPYILHLPNQKPSKIILLDYPEYQIFFFEIIRIYIPRKMRKEFHLIQFFFI